MNVVGSLWMEMEVEKTRCAGDKRSYDSTWDKEWEVPLLSDDAELDDGKDREGKDASTWYLWR